MTDTIKKFYALTMRYTNLKIKEPTKELYEERLEKMRKTFKCLISHIRYENTSGLHCHATIIFDLDIAVSFNFNRFRCRGWSTHVVPITYLDGWIDYCDKDIDDIPDDDKFYKISNNLCKTQKKIIPTQTLSPQPFLQTLYDLPDEVGVTDDDYRELVKFNSLK